MNFGTTPPSASGPQPTGPTRTIHTPKAQISVRYIGTDVSYPQAVHIQEEAVAGVFSGDTKEQLIACEHPQVYTCGTSHSDSDLINKLDIQTVLSGRGGKVTYHGPGQRVLYPILDLSKRKKDLHLYIRNLQRWLILTLADFGIEGHTRDEVGVWVQTPAGPEKIAAIGVRVRRWVTFHGAALNVHPDLSAYDNIIPCGLKGMGVTSMHKLGVNCSLAEVDQSLLRRFQEVFECEVV